MSDLETYQAYARQSAARYGVDQSTFLGLIQTESSWNPTAQASTSSAFGFTQLLRGTAKGLGVNQYNWQENIDGGAKLLSQLVDKYNGDYTTALAAYHDGNKVGKYGGFDYAAKVKANAKQYVTDASSAVGGGRALLTGLFGTSTGNSLSDGMQAVGGALAAPGDAINAKLDMGMSTLFPRIAIALFALLFIAAGLFMLKPDAITSVAKVAA